MDRAGRSVEAWQPSPGVRLTLERWRPAEAEEDPDDRFGRRRGDLSQRVLNRLSATVEDPNDRADDRIRVTDGSLPHGLGNIRSGHVRRQHDWVRVAHQTDASH